MHNTGSQQDTPKGAPSGPLRYLQDGPSVTDAKVVRCGSPDCRPCTEATHNNRVVGNLVTGKPLDGIELIPAREDDRAVVTLEEVEQALNLGLRFFLRSGIEIVKGPR